MDTVDSAFLAGILDGHSSWSIERSFRKDGISFKKDAVHLSIDDASGVWLEALSERYDMGVVRRQAKTWRWSFGMAEIGPLCRAVLPWMCVRWRQAYAALRAAEVLDDAAQAEAVQICLLANRDWRIPDNPKSRMAEDALPVWTAGYLDSKGLAYCYVARSGVREPRVVLRPDGERAMAQALAGMAGGSRWGDEIVWRGETCFRGVFAALDKHCGSFGRLQQRMASVWSVHAFDLGGVVALPVASAV